MMRLLGFVTGAAAVIGAMVMLLGAPDVQEPAVVDKPEQATAQPASIDKPAGDYDVPVPVAEPVPVVESPAEPIAEAQTNTTPAPLVEPALETPGTDELWHPFWQPFRSQIAANGFASRLTAITDIDYRVLRLKPGAYQVAFAYADDLERSAKLAQIESATGLRVAEAAP